MVTPDEVGRVPLFAELDAAHQARLSRVAADISLAAGEYAAPQGSETPHAPARGEPGPRRLAALPPPSAAAPKPLACAGGGGTLADAQSAPFFPRTSGGYCLDPNGGDKTYGEGGSLPIDKICGTVEPTRSPKDWKVR